MRLLTISIVVSFLSACAVLPFRGGGGPRIIAESQYCGTPSQASQAHYFANANAFRDWIDYRSIDEFEPAMADGGAIVVEMGQRPTGGYGIKLDRGKTSVKNGTLLLDMTWHAPRLDAAVSQALIASCVVIRPPAGNYKQVRVVDQLGNVRGQASIP